ncbi:uncharacterized protein LOC132726074 [Ruditapes philippinarum]|uniref:uncharacterized protein LOC132726074 n=1 Tax=Ruditapes philippinarum TaxID=129788 RepID=UPI00295BF64F|nr:uncharacterized protein LOC132726074 [Ruditapes philippinarum]
MFILPIFLVTLVTINDAQCGTAQHDVYERLLSLENKFERQALRIRTLENTVSAQEKTIAELSERAASQDNDKQIVEHELYELKLKTMKYERKIKRLVKILRQPRMQTNGESSKPNNDIVKASRIRRDDRVTDGKKRFVLDTLETVAFEATIAAVKFVQHNNIHDRVVFDDVSLNVGNGYNAANGTFIAPVGGIYVFSTSVMMNGGNTQDLNMHVILEKNNAEIAGAFAYNQGQYEHSSVTATMDLKAGDTVTVTVERHNDLTFYGDRLTSFTGFLLYSY